MLIPRSLRALPPWLVGVVYLSLIPLFGGIYTFLWQDCYQSTASHEVATKELNRTSKEALRSFLQPWLSHYAAPGFEFLAFEIATPSIEGDIASFSSPITFRLSGTTREEETRRALGYLRSREQTKFDYTKNFWHPDVTMTPVWEISLKDGSFRMGTMPDFFHVKNTQPRDLDKLFSDLQIHVESESETAFSGERTITGKMKVGKALRALLRRLESAAQGFPGPEQRWVCSVLVFQHGDDYNSWFRGHSPHDGSCALASGT